VNSKNPSCVGLVSFSGTTATPILVSPLLRIPHSNLSQGEWQAHKPHGQGCFLFNDGIYIEGNFASGRVSGVAGIYYPNGSYLKGNFHCGKLKDRALFYNSEEDVWSLRDYTNKDDSTVLFEGKGNPVAYSNNLKFLT